MRSKHLSLIIITLAIMCSTTSCATILIGSRENITFNSNLPGDTPVRLIVDGEQIGNKVCFPITVTVRRGYSPSHAIAETEGYEASTVTIRKKFHPAILANLLIGGIIGASVDLGSGAVSQAEKKNYEFYFTKENYKNKFPDNQYVEKNSYDAIYKVGDIYKIGAREIGIVVDVSADGKHGKIIYYYGYQTRKWSNKNDVTGANNSYDGAYNCKILSVLGIKDYPATASCRNGWYLPSAKELALVFENIESINASLTSLGWYTIDSNQKYWTSTETSANEAIAIANKAFVITNKDERANVIVMSTF